jgi:hypothetical protein
LSKLFPSIEEIEKLKGQPTKGEWKLLNFLNDYDDNSLEAYYQPFLNGLRPDIVLMKKGHGVVFIEVKDWDLDLYYTKYGNKYRKWFLKENNAILLSPFEQVDKYKDSLFSIYINNLNELKTHNNSYYGIVKTLVYFSESNKNQFLNTVDNKFKDMQNYLKKDFNYCITKEHLNENKFRKLLEQIKILNLKSNTLFNNDIYNAFKREFMPPKHIQEEGKEINYTQKQKKLIESKPEMKKIKGVVGSGKTIILAKRAISAYKRTNSDILILTFNITLKNYIHDKISEVRENFPWDKFIIKNYHLFIKESLIKAGIKIEGCSKEASQEDIDSHFKKYFYDLEFFQGLKDKLPKYKTILVDEVQDYEKEWLDILKNIFLEKDGEFVLFGDEKQNVYHRELDKDKKIKTNIVGQWNKLNESFRVSEKVLELSLNFQKYFFNKKYDYEELENKNRKIFGFIDYFELSKGDLNKQIFKIIEELNIHRNDIAILGTKIEELRKMEKYYRLNYIKLTTKTFETEETNQKIREDINSNRKINNKQNAIDNAIKDERRSKKYNFWIKKDGLLKMSSINSFKGMEIDTVILIINEVDDNDELIYTGLTRARENLIIFNLGNQRYKDFFAKNQNLLRKKKKYS